MQPVPIERMKLFEFDEHDLNKFLTCYKFSSHDTYDVCDVVVVVKNRAEVSKSRGTHVVSFQVQLVVAGEELEEEESFSTMASWMTEHCVS